MLLHVRHVIKVLKFQFNPPNYYYLILHFLSEAVKLWGTKELKHSLDLQQVAWCTYS